MADNVNGIWKLADVLKTMTASGNGSKVISRVREVDSEGNVWVVPTGSDEAFPVSYTTADVSPGDTVVVTIENGKASVDGSTSAPSISAAKANELLQPIAESASTARAMAGAAAAAAESAQESADQAAGAASSAQRSADSAADAAQDAWDRAGSALANAARAQSAADAAQGSADAAQGAADSALVQLATVEDVMGTATWIAEHGTYELTEDTEVDDSKVYYERTGSGTSQDPYVYTEVAQPTGNPKAQGYYELHVEQAVSQYVASHLALTDAGLYVLRDASGYKLLLANTSMSVIDPDGHVVVTYGSSIGFDPTRPFSIGNQDAYVLFTPATQSEEAKVVIGGNVVLGESRTLSELLGEVDNTIVFKVTEEYSQGESSVTLTAHVYRGGEDVASSFRSTDFAWYRKNENGAPEVPLGNGRTITVSRSTVGYGAAIKCNFTPPNDSELLDSDDNTLTDSEGTPIAARTPSGDYVRVADLEAITTVFDTDKLMLVGSEQEQLVTIATLKDVFGDGDYERLDNMPSIEDVTLVGNKTFPDLGIFKTDSQGYSVADDYTLTTLDINALWANAQPIGA